MFLGIDWAPWLPVLTGVLILLTVLVGIRGLYQDHTKDGKLTRAGRGVVAAMILLGILTFVSGMLNQRIADQKEKAEAAERQRQFQAQIRALRSVTGTLRGVSGSLSDLQGGMQNSLRSQQELFGKADENLVMSAGLQRQAQANTISVLRRVFEESNRVSAERIAVGVVDECQATDHPYPRFPIMREVTLTIGHGGGRREVNLTTTQKLELSEGVIFHGFLGDMGDYETFPAWRSARVSIRLLSVPILGTPLVLSEAIERYEEERRSRGLAPEVTTCSATATLYLNGRRVLTASGPLIEDGKSGYVGQFDNLRVDPNRLPSYPD